MKFIKNNFKVIISFIVGVILASSITVYATSYFAKDISYSKDGTEINNVQDALNDLYLKSQISDNCKYFEFEHKSNSQFNYDFGFVPSRFMAVYTLSGERKMFMTYNINGNGILVLNTSGGNDSSYYSLDSTILKSNLSTDFSTYEDSYKIYVFAYK